jgi:hypothetical protein
MGSRSRFVPVIGSSGKRLKRVTFPEHIICAADKRANMAHPPLAPLQLLPETLLKVVAYRVIAGNS